MIMSYIAANFRNFAAKTVQLQAEDRVLATVVTRSHQMTKHARQNSNL